MNTDENIKEDGTAENNGTGDKYETTPIIERAREEREKLDATNKKTEELIERQEALMVKKELGGQSEAGQQPIKAEPISDKDYANKVLTGDVNPLKEDGYI